jgi:alpha-glucuronidase
VLAPGETFTVRYDAQVPLDEEPGDVTVAGRASYRTTAGATVELPVQAGVEVVAPVEVTALDAPRPLLGGAENQVTVSVRNNRSSEPVAVSAGVDAPAGWQSGSTSQTIAPQSAAAITVAVTPPLEPPEGRVTMSSLAARVSAGDVPVHGQGTTQTWAAPSGDQAVLALDAGHGPLLGSYQLLTRDDAWDPARGFGWVETRPDSRDRGAPDLLRRDFIWSGTGRTPGTLRVALPAGQHRVFVLTGDNGFMSSDTVVFADGERVAETGELLPAGQFKWFGFELDGGAAGRTVDLRFVGEDHEQYWRVNALVVLRQGG